jgi:hypothetical protein
MGLPGPVRRSTLADANETRDWRIYAEFAQRLIAQARRLYAGDDLDVDLPSTVYALDSTTIDLCLSVFPWANFRSTKAAVKMHTLLDLRGNIPSFIHISEGKLHDLESLGFAQNFLSSCELEALHFIGIGSFGEEFREDVVFRGIQEQFRKPLA